MLIIFVCSDRIVYFCKFYKQLFSIADNLLQRTIQNLLRYRRKLIFTGFQFSFMRYLFLTAFIFLISLSSTLAAQSGLAQQKALSLGFEYTADNIYNFKGGVDRGYAYIGLAHLQLDLDTEKAGWWKGGSFLLNLSNAHGRAASEELIGDFQVISGIEAGNHLFIQDLWLKQLIGNFEFTIGIQELNIETAHLELGELFVHSSFGVSPILSGNFDGPIYPFTSTGVTTKWFINENLTWLNAFYAGKATDKENYFFNGRWTLKPGSGQLFVSEIQHRVDVNNLPGKYKVGLFSNNHILEKAFTDHFPDSLSEISHGIYATYEQKLWELEEKEIYAFAEMGYSPADYSMNKVYLSGGVILNGLLSKKRDDELGLGAAYAGLERGKGHESFIEFTWKKPVTGCFYLQPGFQYVITPSGKLSGIPNSFSGNIRFGVEL